MIENEDIITVEIHFGYFKQGDDLKVCGGDLMKFAEMHRNVAHHAERICNAIPSEAWKFIKIDGDTHMCFMAGPKSVMESLISRGLAVYDPSSDEDDEGEVDW